MRPAAWIGLLGCLPVLGATHPSVPLAYIPNYGQEHPAVRYVARSLEWTAYFTPGAIVLRLPGRAIRMQFPGAAGPARIEPAERLAGVANFLRGPAEDWRTGVPIYGGVVYRGLYPGIDMRYGSGGRSLKSEFVVAPGADPRRIRVRYSGVDGMRIDHDGSLLLEAGDRELRETAPFLYQTRFGTKVPVNGRFVLFGDVVAFDVDDYDPSLPLVIDPVITYSTLLGGSNADAAQSLAVDAAGAVYVAGYTASTDFPTASPEQNWNAGGNEVFVAKLNPAGNGLVYCTYIGGRADDRAYAIAVDSTGAAYVAGATTSANFPLRNPLQAKLAGGRNAFVLKLNPAGNTLVYSTYLGGSGSDAANAIALDAGLNAYVAGDSTSVSFPTTGLQRSKGGSQDAFVVKLSADGARLVYGTYLGGSLDEHAAAIAVDASGAAYVTGSTWSSNFPLVAAYQNHLAGAQDAFVARLAANGASLLFSTYLGGSGGSLGWPEAGQGIALDPQGNAYIAGMTASADFPVKGAAQAANHGWLDAFAAKLSAAGTLIYSTYLGGCGIDQANAIAVDAAGNAYIAGQTSSVDLPVAGAVQSALAGEYDAFVAKLNSNGDSIQVLTYLGGAGTDTAAALRLDSAGKVYIAGWTMSSNFPVLNGFQSTNAGNYGAYVTKLTLDAGAATPAAMTSPAPGSTLTGASVTFQWTTATGASEYSLSVSKVAAGGTDIFGASTGSATSHTVGGLPVDGSTVYVRLSTKLAGTWSSLDYTYKASSSSSPTAMTSPAPGSTLTAASVTFQWSAGSGVSQYWLYVSKVGVGLLDLVNTDEGVNTSHTVSGLPVDGCTLYVRLWSKIGATWTSLDYTYTAATLGPSPAAMTAPADGATLTATAVTFQWTAGTGVSQYWLYISKVAAGAYELYGTDEGTNTAQTVTALPSDGSTLYVRLWSKIGASWLYRDYTYKAVNIGGAVPAVMTSPLNGSTLSGAGVTFQWTTGSGVSEYWLYVSSQALGSAELFNASTGTNTSQTIAGLPTDGSTVYVRLWSKIGAIWGYYDYSYHAANPLAAMISPAGGSGLAGTTVTFQWTAGTATQYWLYISAVAAGGLELYNADQGAAKSRTVTGLPTGGVTLYVRLWSLIGTAWLYQDYTYKAAP